MLLADPENLKEFLRELDPETGQVIARPQVELSYADIHIGAANGSVALAGYIESGYGIKSVDLNAQSTSPLLYFDGTSYGWHKDSLFQDFRVLEDGAVEFLWTDKNGKHCILEKMCMEKVEKIPVVVRGIFFVDFWLSEQVNLFNQGDSDYYVILETCGYGNDLEDFARITSVQVGAGKGPDILCGDYLLHDYINGMLDKDALEELNPYMESSGIREEDYFPLVFATWRQEEKIYSITPKMEVTCEETDANVLNCRETPDIEVLADALLAWEGKGFYRKELTSGELLNTFLQGSENLWGMVDWGTGEKDSSGSCNFNTPLFGKLLETARRYGYTDKRMQEQEIAYMANLNYFFHFNSPKEQEAKKRLATGTLFDDGCYAVSSPLYTMAVNANSASKEGAWEFLAFLLGEEVQYRKEAYLPPVHRESFDKWLEWELQWLTEPRFENGKEITPVYNGENTSAEKINAYKKAIEDARPLPIRTAPILTIIQEEAKDYFNGSKSAEEVSRVINNRVQLFLDERK